MLNDGYTIPAGIYHGTEAVDTLSVWNVLVVNKGMSEELAYQLTQAVFENMDGIRKIVKAAESTTVDNATMLSAVPMHSGAKKYFDSLQK